MRAAGHEAYFMSLFHALRAAGLSLALAALAAAALPIELEVAAEGDAPLGAMQEWNRVLVEMDLARVRLRGAHAGDEPRLEVQGTGDAARYVLLGVLNRRDELVLPGGKFRQSQRAELKQFFQDLPRRESQRGVERAPFALTREEFLQVAAELSRPFDESTLDGAPHELLTALTRDVPLPVEGDVAMKAVLRDAPPFRAQMKGLSVGTILAAVLRSAGLQFVPDKLGRAPITLRVSPLDAAAESWPVGWKPAGSPRAIAPKMYVVRNIELSNFTLDKALEALAGPFGTPIVVDQRTVDARKIDLASVSVKFPRTKTYVRRVVDHLLSQGRLSGELRVDDAGTPFYWVTQFGKDSPRAMELTAKSAKNPNDAR
jgi:hypothetical protein